MNILGLYISGVLIIYQVQSTISDGNAENVHEPDDHWIVQTDSGPVEGTVTAPYKDLQVYVFYGIPYAEPPTGDRRFKQPHPVKPWTDVLQATKKALPCYQQGVKNSVGPIRYDEKPLKRPWSEDCLKMNIWVPKPKVHDAPVLVVFHSGGFDHGSNDYPTGSLLSARSEDIVVSVNYRLGTFGFLNLGVPDAPGNMGLLDQQLALKWINENVHHFGGLKAAILLIGAGGAGAASVGYHVLAPGSAQYFTSVSTFSGSPLCPWAFQERTESISNSKILSERLGCSKEKTEDELNCLRNAHPEDIIDANSIFTKRKHLRILPTVDGTFIEKSPLDILSDGHFKKTVILSLSTMDEGSWVVNALTSDLMPRPEDGMDMDVFRKTVMRLDPTLSKAGLRAVEDYYVDKCHKNNPEKIRDGAIRVYSDFLIDCSMNLFHERVVAQGGIVFHVVDDVRKESAPIWVGASHGIGIEFGFGYPIIEEGYSENEILASWGFLDWINEHTRKKASEMQRDLVRFDLADKNYTVWNLEGPTYFSHYREAHCKLWNEIIPKLQKRKPCGHE